MKKQRASEVLMETLCLSVPYDPVFVLEVHKDVLITRLRCASFVLKTNLCPRIRNPTPRRRQHAGGPSGLVFPVAVFSTRLSSRWNSMG